MPRISTLLLSLNSIASFLFCLGLSTPSRAEDPKEWLWYDRWVTSMAPGQEGTMFASLATSMPHREGAVVKFSAENPDEAKEIYRHPSAVWAVATSPDKSTLASTDFHGNLAITPISGGETKQFEKAFVRWTRALAFGPDSKHIAAGNEAGTVFVWSIAEGKSTSNRDLASGQIMSMAFSPNGEQLAVATGSGKLHIVKWPSLEAIREVAIGDKPIWSVTFGTSNDLLWVGCADGTVKRVAKEGDPTDIAKLNDWVTSITSLPGGGLVAVSMRGQIKRSSKPDPKSLTEWAVGPKGIWDVKAIDSDRILVATQKLGPTMLQSVGQVQYIAKDAATKAAERKAAEEKAAKEKAEAEKREADRLMAEKLAAERKAAAEKAAAEKAAADKAAAEKKAAADKAKKEAEDKAAAEKAAAEKAKKEAADKAAADKAEAEKKEKTEKPAAEKP
jgi:hypothetical protein